jgi:sRNA-binding carbon storage regulator CsrA
MLVLSRRSGQIIQITPRPTLDPATPIIELFRHGPIEVVAVRIDNGQVRLGFNAHPELLVLRQELVVEINS